MATVGGLSSGTSSGVSMYGASIKGYGGLASGLDTDSLIEGMTLGTRTKIQELLKKKTTNQWQTDLYRSVSDKLIELQTKYLDTSTTSSLLRPSFFDKNLITVMGANSSKLSVTGASSTLEKLKVLGVSQMAKDTNLITNGSVSEQALNTGEINLNGEQALSLLEGANLQFTYGAQKYTITLNSGREYTVKTKVTGADGTETTEEKKVTTDFTTPDKMVESINAILQNTNLAGDSGVTLGSKLEMALTADGKFEFKAKDGADLAGNTLELSGGTDAALEALGFKSAGSDFTAGSIKKDSSLVASEAADINKLQEKKHVWKELAGKSITFDYNGIKKKITLPDKDWNGWKDADGDGVLDDPDAAKADLQTYIQKELDTAFGKGRVKIETKDNTAGDAFNLSFSTYDKSSVLRMTSADDGLMGKTGLLGITYSETNRLNMDVSIAESGLKGLKDASGNSLIEKDPADPDGKKYKVSNLIDEKGELKLKINGKDIKGLTVESTMSDIIRAVNSSDAGVTMNYLETSDVFTLTSNVHGEAGTIDFGGDFADALFGTGSDYKLNRGQDAVMTVEYEGGVTGTIVRDSNSFSMDGATFTLKGTFGSEVDTTLTLDALKQTAIDTLTTDGYAETSAGSGIYEKKDSAGVVIDSINLQDKIDSLIEDKLKDGFVKNSDGDYVKYKTVESVNGVDQALTFNAEVDADKVVESVKSMIDEYNALIKEVNKIITQKPDRNYGPLTDDEKNGLSESEIKALEDKAKEGILFNDSLLRTLSDRLRTVFTGSVDAKTLENMGLTVSSSYSENGKINFNETKFRAALAEDPEKVKNIFTRPAETDADGKITDQGGISVRMKNITYDFANVMGTKGLLIKKAGSSYSALSELDNAMLKIRKEIDTQVDKLKSKLQTEINRYTRQFSSLEQLISQMNSQSSYFSQMSGG